MKIGRRMMMPLYLDPEKKEFLDMLSKATRVPMAAYLREAVDDLLTKYSRALRAEKKRREREGQ